MRTTTKVVSAARRPRNGVRNAKPVPLHVALFTGAQDKSYALGLTEALVIEGVVSIS